MASDVIFSSPIKTTSFLKALLHFTLLWILPDPFSELSSLPLLNDLSLPSLLPP